MLAKPRQAFFIYLFVRDILDQGCAQNSAFFIIFEVLLVSEIDVLRDCVRDKNEQIDAEHAEVPFLLVLEEASHADHLRDTLTIATGHSFIGAAFQVIVEFNVVGESPSIKTEAHEVAQRDAANHHFQLVHEAVNTGLLNIELLDHTREVGDGAEQEYHTKARAGHFSNRFRDLKFHEIMKASTIGFVMVESMQIVDSITGKSQHNHIDNYEENIYHFGLLGYSRFGRISKLLRLFESATPGHLDDLNCLK